MAATLSAASVTVGGVEAQWSGAGPLTEGVTRSTLSTTQRPMAGEVHEQDRRTQRRRKRRRARRRRPAAGGDGLQAGAAPGDVRVLQLRGLLLDHLDPGRLHHVLRDRPAL